MNYNSYCLLLEQSLEDWIVCGEARFFNALRDVTVEVRRRQVDAPIDKVEDDEGRREDAPRQPVDVLRSADPPLGVAHYRTPAVLRRR